MPDLTLRTTFSYRNAPDIPAFEDHGAILFMDGECALCTAGARLIARFDRKGVFRICPVHAPLGQAAMRHHGIDPDDPESWLMLSEGRAYGSLDAVIRAGALVGGPGWALQPLRLLPRMARDWLYRLIARNRYRLFGRTDMCAVPDSALRARLMT